MEAPDLFIHRSSSDTNKNTAGDNNFIVEDLLDFSNDNDIIDDGPFDTVTPNSTNSSSLTVLDISNSSFSDPNFPSDPTFASNLCVPNDDLAELEWLSNFTEESFSSEDLQKLQLISGMQARREELSKSREIEQNLNQAVFEREMPVPAKARSKRSRAAPGNWSSRLLVLSSKDPDKKPAVKVPQPKKREENNGGGEWRRCLHCATDTTPQWRTGPMGPKTLCNACGVRYKSGRLVPEYRPASSPTFVLTKHSNSHRKVMELRRQKEVIRTQQQFLHHHHHHHHMVFDPANEDDYLIHQPVGPDFRQLI